MKELKYIMLFDELDKSGATANSVLAADASAAELRKIVVVPSSHRTNAGFLDNTSA